jgi:hypothetical protein
MAKAPSLLHHQQATETPSKGWQSPSTRNDPPSSTINQHHLLFRGYLKQVKGRTGGQNEHLMSIATVWLLR